MTHWCDESKILPVISTDDPLPEDVITELAAGVSEWDCEMWSAQLGDAIVARFRRERTRRTSGDPLPHKPVE